MGWKTEDDLTCDAIMERAQRGEPISREELGIFFRAFGRSIATSGNVYDELGDCLDFIETVCLEELAR